MVGFARCFWGSIGLGQSGPVYTKLYFDKEFVPLAGAAFLKESFAREFQLF